MPIVPEATLIWRLLDNNSLISVRMRGDEVALQQIKDIVV
jgi:hypothetical protein